MNEIDMEMIPPDFREAIKHEKASKIGLEINIKD